LIFTQASVFTDHHVVGLWLAVCCWHRSSVCRWSDCNAV